MARRRVSILAVVLIGNLPWLCVGCGSPSSTAIAGGATTAPASASGGGPAATQPATGESPTTQAASRPEKAPLPEKALWKLERLTPTVAKPSPSFRTFEVPLLAQSLVAEAEALIVKRDYAGAVERLERAAGFDPDNPRIRRALGVAYGGLANPARAQENLQRSAKVAPDDLEVQFLLGRFAEVGKKYDEAILAYRTALQCGDAVPTNAVTAETLYRLGGVLHQAGYLTASLECFDRLEQWIAAHGRDYMNRAVSRELVLRPEQMMLARGQVLFDLRRYDEARKLLQRAYRRNRSDPTTARRYLECLVAMKDVEAAEGLLTELAAEPSLRGSLSSLVETFCLASGEREAPRRIWQAYLRQHAPDETLGVALAQAALKLQADGEATAILESILATRPGSVPAGQILVHLWARQGQADKALRLLGSLVAADPGQTQAVRDILRVIVRGGLEDDFERDFAAKVRPEADAALLYVVGELALLRGKKFLAGDQYRRAIEAREDFLPAYDSLMQVCLEQREYDKARELIDRAARLKGDEDTREHFVQYLQGRLALAQGDVTAALTALQLANARKNGHLPTLRLLAEAYARAGSPHDAIATYKAALVQSADDEDIYRRLFDLYVALRQMNEAGDLAADLLRRDPTSLRGRLVKTEYLLLSGKSKEAGDLLAGLRREQPDNVEVRLLSFRLTYGIEPAAMSEEKLAQARKELEDIARLEGAGPDVKQMLARLLERNNKHAEAASVWGRLYEEMGRPMDIGREYVAALMQAEQYQEALDVLKEFRAGGEKAAWVRQATLAALEKLKRTDEVERLAGQWIQESTDDREKAVYRAMLLELYKDGKHYDKAHKVLDDWLASGTAGTLTAALRREKLLLYADAKQYDEAVEFARNWIQLETLETDFLPKQILIRVMSDAKQYDKILPLLSEWIRSGQDIRDPNVARQVGLLKYYRVTLMGESGKVDPAVAEGMKFVAAMPEDLILREAVFVTLVQAERYEQAGQIVEKWLAERTRPAATQASRPETSPEKPKADPIASWCRQGIVRVWLLRQKYAEGIQVAERLLRDDPTDSELLNLYASCLSEAGRSGDAHAALEKAVESAEQASQKAETPEDKQEKLRGEAMIKNNLAYMYADKGVKLDRAERLIRDALMVRPGEVSLQDTFGWILYKQGKFADAARVFELALDQGDPEETAHAVIHDHAGDVYWRLGRADKAAACWKKAVELARAEKIKSSEIQTVLDKTPGKIRAADAKGAPEVAPLGEGVPDDRKAP